MLRFIVILLAGILLITVVRSLAGIVLRGFAELMKSESGPAPRTASKQDVPIGGELKRDPVCGTFVSTATSMKKTSGAATVYFCSAECRDKYLGGSG